jgi:hypothetical protein
MTPADHEWTEELRVLRERGVTLAAGLSENELRCAEHVHGFRFPSDLRTFLACALPIGARFPDWRNPDSAALHDWMAQPFDGIAFDIEHAAFWWNAWGPRPAALSDALAVARAAVESAPCLIPVFGHRFLPAEPETAGNPVLSVHQTDIIYYGLDLRRYVACEFGGLKHAEAVRQAPRRIRFGTDLVEANG